MINDNNAVHHEGIIPGIRPEKLEKIQELLRLTYVDRFDKILQSTQCRYDTDIKKDNQIIESLAREYGIYLAKDPEGNWITTQLDEQHLADHLNFDIMLHQNYAPDYRLFQRLYIANELELSEAERILLLATSLKAKYVGPNHDDLLEQVDENILLAALNIVVDRQNSFLVYGNQIGRLLYTGYIQERIDAALKTDEGVKLYPKLAVAILCYHKWQHGLTSHRAFHEHWLYNPAKFLCLGGLGLTMLTIPAGVICLLTSIATTIPPIISTIILGSLAVGVASITLGVIGCTILNHATVIEEPEMLQELKAREVEIPSAESYQEVVTEQGAAAAAVSF